MGSPVTLSGFNKIDFGMILDAVMTQESAPLTTLEAQQRTLQSRATTYRTLAAKLSTFQTAVEALTKADSLAGRATSNTDTSIVNASTSDAAVPGIYDVIVQELARAQVTASTNFPPDADQTVVAWGGALTIGGVAVNIDAPVTLQGLADRINNTADVPVTATVIRASGTSWQLVLTGKATGAGGQFDISNSLTGGSGITFGDGNGDGISGNSPEDNAVSATDARALINNVVVTSSTNTIVDAVPGVTLALLRRAPDTTATISIAEDLSAAKARVQKVVEAFNELVKFSEDQNLAASRGDTSSIARDPLLRGLRGALRERLTGDYASAGDLSTIATVGLGFDRTGRLQFDDARFDEVAKSHRAELGSLFAGSEAEPGVFTALRGVVESYTASNGLLRDMQDRLTDQSRGLGTRIADLEARLMLRRATLQREYIAADLAMSRLNADMSSLNSLGGQYRLF
jgi:flagellar hook-associated protein 2